MYNPLFLIILRLTVLQAVAAFITNTQSPEDIMPEPPTGAIPMQDVPKPFRVIWNNPDFPCWSKGIDFNLESYGIESNGKSFMGDTISLYYSLGKWPRVNLRNRTQLLDGGLPQYGNLTAHLDSVRKGVLRYTSPTAFGYGVIDMETWRPILETSFGWLAPYKQIQTDEIKKQDPTLSAKDAWTKAMQVWYAATRVLMESALTLAKFLRPLRAWGYYGYPELTSYGTPNDRLAWLWSITTVFYPSIYIYNFKSLDYTEKNIAKAISETFRVRALYGDPDAPIMVYTLVQTEALGKFYGKWLDKAVEMPLEMGVEGIVLWGSSSNYKGNSTDQCLQMQSYVKTTLGPKVKNLIDRMTLCSTRLCGAHGRCVNKKYANKFKYLRDRGLYYPKSFQSIHHNHTERSPINDTVSFDFITNYVCQCYTGWTGTWCAQYS